MDKELWPDYDWLRYESEQWPTREAVSSDICRAARLAQQFHGDQRYGDRPYFEHLRAVAGLVNDYRFPLFPRRFLNNLVGEFSVRQQALTPWIP